MVRHFLRDDDLSADEQRWVLELALRLKADRFALQPLAGPRTVAVLFDKPTLRTQVSFTAGVVELGGYPMVVDGKLAQIGVRESVADTARVLGRQVSAIVWRGRLPADRFDEFLILARRPAKEGPLAFPATQSCGNVETRWVEEVGPHGDRPKHPAPKLMLTPAVSPADHSPHAQDRR